MLARRGATSNFLGYHGFPAVICASPNDVIVHGIPGPRRLVAGDVVKLDVTAVKGGYVADAARTVVLDGAPEEAHRLAACAEAAFIAALAVARAGNRVNAIGRAVHDTVSLHGFSVVPSLEGHGVGRAIHEAPSVPNWFDRRQRDVLQLEKTVVTGAATSVASQNAAQECQRPDSDRRYARSRRHSRPTTACPPP